MADQKSLDLDYRELSLLTIRKQYDNFLLGVIVFLGITFLFIQLLKLNRLLSFNHIEKKPSIQKMAEAKPDVYTVKDGDALWQIAQQKYGNGNMMQEIMKANKISDPNSITVGQVLVLPSPNPTLMAQTGTPSPTPQGQISAIQTKQVTITGDKYTIQDGDGIWTIAERAYGDGSMWQKIVQANNLKEPYNLEVGKTLSIPR
jgi:nucleoid-associated protein YgaU